MTARLNKNEYELLHQTIADRRPCMLFVVEKAQEGQISPEEREALTAVLTNAFLDHLDRNDEPDARAIKLEHVIDALKKVSPLQVRDVDEDAVDKLLDCRCHK